LPEYGQEGSKHI